MVILMAKFHIHKTNCLGGYIYIKNNGLIRIQEDTDSWLSLNYDIKKMFKITLF